ncbi:retrovirus-related pol polyprotein from transposon TNT 1-94 [Tanacetum coccineum]
MDSIISLGQKNTLAEYMILSSADNRPPMLDKDLYNSWKKNGVIRTKKYAELSVLRKIQADCDMKATNIILQGLPTDIYSLVNHHRVAKDLWERGESLHTYYLRFTQLINDMNIYKMKMEQFQVNTKFLNSLPPEWSKFVTDVKLVKDLHTSNFDQLHAYLEQHELYANDVRIMRERNQDPLAFVANQQMTPPHFNTYQSYYNNPQLQQQFSPSQHGSIQPNQQYSSHYPSQTQFNHSSIPPSHAFQSQMNHQTLTVPQVIPQVAYQSPQAHTQPMTESPFRDSGSVVPVFSPGDDMSACLNKAMAFLTVVASSRFLTTNNQLRTSSNLRNQATIQDGRVTVQQVQGRQGQNYSGTTYKSNATSSRGNTRSGQARVVRCYNCQGEGHMARQCTQPKKPRNAAWYKEKAMLAEAHEAGQILDEKQLAFLADPGIPADQAQTIIPHNAAFQTEDLDTYDSDYDDLSTTQAVLMANISNYGSDIISEVPNSETYLNDMDNQSVQALQDFEQTPVIDFTDNKISRKEIVKNVVHTPSATTIAPGMFKLDLEPLPPRLLQNREVYIANLRNTQEQANILWEIVEQAKAKQHLDSELDLACKYATRIQELLVYVQDTCPNAITSSAKKVTVRPMNNVKKVRFAEPLTSSSKIQQVESSNISDSNTPVLTSTGVKCSTSNCGSKPPSNKENDRISQTPSKNKKNKVEAQPRKVNKVNRVVKPVCDVDVKHSLPNANSKILYATCNKSIFDGVHDKCLLDLVQNRNKCTKSAKKYKKQIIWKPTGHVFTYVGFKWKPTGRIFTIVGNSCPLTRFTSTNLVPPKQTTSHLDEIQKPEIKVYLRKPKNVNHIGSSKIAKIVESKNANHSEPNHTWGSNAIDIPSSSSLVMTGCPDCTLVSGLRMFKTHDRESLSAHELWLGHNLFSVGQFCDANLEVAFRKNTCFIRNLEGVDLLAKDSLARGITRLKFQKDHLCSACALGKSKKYSHQPKAEDTNQEKLYLLHMDLCGPMRVASINGKMYILVIVDDYSRFTWVRFLKIKDEAPAAIIKCQEVATPRAEVLADSLVSTSIDHDAPSTSIPSSQEQEQSPIISQGFEELPKTPTFHDDPLNESPNEDSTSHGSSSNVRQIHTPFEHLDRWTKDHPIANVIDDPSRSVSTRKQLKTDVM